MCIDILEIWFGIAYGQISLILAELSAQDTPIFSFHNDNLSIRQWIFTKLGMCIDIMEFWIGIANGQILWNFDRVICPRRPYFSFQMITWVKVKGF